MKEKMILADGTELEIESGSSIDNVMVVSNSIDEVYAKYDSMTDENLKHVIFKNASEEKVGIYENLTLVSETTESDDETFLTHFRLREKAAIELKVEDLEKRVEQTEANNDYLAMELGVEL